MIRSEAKTAEFARLFDLFETLKSRRTRSKSIGAGMPASLDDTKPVAIPADLAPIIASLASIVGIGDSQVKRRSRKGHGGETLKNGVDLDSEDDESLAKFPLGKQYPFTFKMMLHKLYELDDWAKKVKEVLERSQIEYKPLSDNEKKFNATVRENAMNTEYSHQGGSLQFKIAANGGRRTTQNTRQRSYSVACIGKPRGTNILTVPAPKLEGQQQIRILKKRCVGRRKSISGPFIGAEGVGMGWVYDAAISCTENEITPQDSKVTFATQALAPTTKRARYPSLGVGGKRKICNTGRRASAGVPGSFSRTIGNNDGYLSHNPAVPDETERNKMKRPFIP